MHIATSCLIALFGSSSHAQSPSDLAGALGSLLLKGKGEVFPAMQHPNEPLNSAEVMKSAGSGPYPAHFFGDSGLPRHTIYAPRNPDKSKKTPILLWGNGGCVAAGTASAPFLVQIASYGYTVLANGYPIPTANLTYSNMRTFGQSNKDWLKGALDWAVSASKTDKWAHLDIEKVATGGQSCGGAEAAWMAQDPRVKTIGIFNSGAFAAGSLNLTSIPKGAADGFAMLSTPNGSTFKIPAFYFLGGPIDVAYENGKRDYSLMKPGVPAWIGHYAPNGHAGTYNQLNGGKYGELAPKWLKFIFSGDRESALFFKEDKMAAAGWSEIEKKDLDKIPVI